MKQLEGGKESPDSKVPALAAECAQIVWREAAVYQPTLLGLSEFLYNIRLDAQGPPTFQSQRSLLVFIERDCNATMEAHARTDIRREQAGILCGQAHVDAVGQHYVNIRLAVPVDTLNDASHFRFHQESWEAVWSRGEEPANIVGWYHTHPGMGVFLSGTDLRTQKLYFSSPWQVAVVLDPVSRQAGFFRGAAGVQVLSDEVFRYTTRGEKCPSRQTFSKRACER
jgi:proteasome lid subunit RPN8/RPN11